MQWTVTWKRRDGDVCEQSYNGYANMQDVKNSWYDYWGVALADLEYFEIRRGEAEWRK